MKIKNPQKQSLLKFCAVGDLSLADGVESMIIKHGADFTFSKIRKTLSGHDVAFANLENVFTDTDEGRVSQAHLLKSRPESMRAVHDAGFNVVSMANNHVLDYGKQAIVDTKKILDDCGIKYTGAGTHIAAAREPAVIEAQGVSLGFLAYAMKGIHSAEQEQPGAAVIDREQITEDITTLKPKVDHVIVSLHYGLEFLDYPSPEFREICLHIADLGASLVIGHHPHVINGLERHANCLIAYSLGNFIFDDRIMDYKTEKTRRGLVLHCTFDKKNLVDFEAVPTLINDDLQPEPATGPLRESMLKKIEEISSVLATDKYPAVYFKQANELWPKINLMVNLRILREQGIIAFLKRLPRIKKKYITMSFKFAFNKALGIFRK